MHGPSYIEKCTYTKLPLKINEDVPLIKTQNTRSQLHTMIQCFSTPLQVQSAERCNHSIAEFVSVYISTLPCTVPGPGVLINYIPYI